MHTYVQMSEAWMVRAVQWYDGVWTVFEGRHEVDYLERDIKIILFSTEWLVNALVRLTTILL